MLRDWFLIRIEMKSPLKDAIWVKSERGKRMSLESIWSRMFQVKGTDMQIPCRGTGQRRGVPNKVKVNLQLIWGSSLIIFWGIWIYGTDFWKIYQWHTLILIIIYNMTYYIICYLKPEIYLNISCTSLSVFFN